MGLTTKNKRALIALALLGGGVLTAKGWAGVVVGVILSGTYLVASNEAAERRR